MRASNGTKLGNFVDKNRLSIAAAARALGVSRATLLDWIAGTKEPKEKNRRMIARWTDGVIKVDDWPSARKEREQVEQIEPFRKDDAANS